MTTFVFKLTVLGPLLSVEVATNDTVSVQSVPSSSGVITKAGNGVIDEDRMFNPLLANAMDTNKVNTDLELARMVLNSHGVGDLSRLIGAQKLVTNGEEMTEKMNVARRNANRIEIGLYKYWKLNDENLDKLVARFIEKHDLPLDNVEKAAKFLFQENVYQVLITFASQSKVVNPEKTLARALYDRCGLLKVAEMILIAKTQNSAIKTMETLFEQLVDDEIQVLKAVQLLELDKIVDFEQTMFNLPQMFFLKNYVRYIASKTSQDSGKLLIDTLAHFYGRINTARIVQKAIKRAKVDSILARVFRKSNILTNYEPVVI
ncbi:uncharacterized protein PHALS_13904 [Plasmopara halstedii]|uniref:RxLR-like protein n=1 Tax=Plasmopara halstedii TaxID=4781 RepID=A0A0P1A513_PLAHL|nr:uncharacterized protein PHALS_13904 [Plasmopara halstedii]CEG35150.1 hypothetical protein PHALS_13904 [Plasmopara halstedii]|eukprot:XP_024571519.1 hypothetical protein PHALS_13904 [Plasmopara halstedii]